MSDLTIYEVTEELEKQFPNIKGMKVMNGYIHLGNAAEGGTIDEMPAADYYGEFRDGRPWINQKLLDAMDNHGLFIDWVDGGTLAAFPEDQGYGRDNYEIQNNFGSGDLWREN